VLQRFVINLLEAVEIVRVGEVVEGDAEKSAAPRVAGRLARIETDGALRVQVGHLGAEAGQRLRRIDLVDRRVASVSVSLRPLRRFDAGAQEEKSPPRSHREHRGSVWLLESVVGARGFGRLGAEAV